jgi:hypothetical protein
MGKFDIVKRGLKEIAPKVLESGKKALSKLGETEFTLKGQSSRLKGLTQELLQSLCTFLILIVGLEQ